MSEISKPQTDDYVFKASDPTKQNSKFLLFFAISIIILIIIIFSLLTLVYFNIISFSKINSNKTNLIPSKTLKNIPNISPIIEYNTLKSTPMSNCVLLTGCKDAVQLTATSTISAAQNFYGLGFNLNTPVSTILAAIDGKISTTKSIENGESLTIVTITDPENIQQFVYKFKIGAYSPTLASGSIKQDQKIGDLKNSAPLIYVSKPYSFILYMYVIVSNEYVKLQPSVDGLTLESPNK